MTARSRVHNSVQSGRPVSLLRSRGFAGVERAELRVALGIRLLKEPKRRLHDEVVSESLATEHVEIAGPNGVRGDVFCLGEARVADDEMIVVLAFDLRLPATRGKRTIHPTGEGEAFDGVGNRVVRSLALAD